MSFDLVIVGAGLAGLTTANRAAALGLRPLVLEQGDPADYPCNSRYAGGLLHVAFKDLRATPSELADSVARVVGSDTTAGQDPATAQAQILAEYGAHALDWLRNEGARFIKGGPLEFMRWVLAPPRPRRPGLEWKGRGPDVLLRRLAANLGQRGGEIRFAARALELDTGPAGVLGIKVIESQAERTIPTASVVIADGGFQGNPELLRRYISPRPERLFQRGAGTGVGDGLRMAEAIGARLVGMDRFYGHLLGQDVFSNPLLWPYPTVDAIAQSAVIVNRSGERFLDEGRGGVYAANEIAKLEDPWCATVVFDETVWTGVAADRQYPPCMNSSFVDAGGTVFRAATIPDLANLIDVPVAALCATLSGYNKAIESDSEGELAPPRSQGPSAARPLDAAPWRAIRVCPGITYTMGGAEIDRQARVQHADGRSIPGLYAVGSACGGLEGGARAAYLGGLAKAVVTGLRAAESIANRQGVRVPQMRDTD